jgi:hypothetical protein
MALITNLDEIKAHVTFTMATKIESLNSFIELAEMTYLIPEIGQAAYDDLHTKYKANNLDADFKKLLLYCQRAVSFYATELYVPSGQLHISDAGIRINVDENFKQAFDWQVDNLQESLRNLGDASIEILLAFLESKKNVFTVWAGSSAFTQYKDCLVNSSDQFNELVGVKIPRRIFRRVLPELRKVQKNHIYTSVCKDLYNELLTQWKDGTTTSLNKSLLELIQPAMAHIAIAKSVSSLSVRLTDLGVSVATNSIMKSTIRQAADDVARAHFINDKMDDGQNFVKQLVQYLYDNVSDYPLFESSSCYNSGRVTDYNNDETSGIYIV